MTRRARGVPTFLVEPVPGRVDQILADIEAVKEVLLMHGVDPDEVADEIHPDQANNSSY